MGLYGPVAYNNRAVMFSLSAPAKLACVYSFFLGFFEGGVLMRGVVLQR